MEETFMSKRLVLFVVTVAILAVIGGGYAWHTEANSPRAMSKKIEGDGTSGRLARWTATDLIGASNIEEDANGFFAIGTPINSNFKFILTSDLASPKATFRSGNSADGRAIEGSSVNGIGINGIGFISGINGLNPTTNPEGAGVRGVATNGAWSGDFIGPFRVQGDVQVFQDLHVFGTLTKAAGSFRIDHPLDPKNKYLSHSFVESPDMMNIYNGNVTTDSRGAASVELPAYFEALNRDFRYQLTVIGGDFAQAIVAGKIHDNRFSIKTNKPRIEVSWQVTGVRKDKYAETHRIQVESMKPAAEQGKTSN
jgi:hypothetical protein